MGLQSWGLEAEATAPLDGFVTVGCGFSAQAVVLALLTYQRLTRRSTI